MPIVSISSECFGCSARNQEFCCNLSDEVLQRLSEIKLAADYPKGAMLFVEGQHPNGVFVLCSGRAKLFTSSREGKTIITRIAGPGALLGWNSVFSKRPYGVSAEMMTTGRASFIPRNSLLPFLQESGEAALRIAEQLSHNYYIAHEDIRNLAFGAPDGRLAKLLLSWSTKAAENTDSIFIEIQLTQMEMAERIGLARETVSRLFIDFMQRGLLQKIGSRLFLCNGPAMERLAQF